jgi:hypothetical protein
MAYRREGLWYFSDCLSTKKRQVRGAHHAASRSCRAVRNRGSAARSSGAWASGHGQCCVGVHRLQEPGSGISWARTGTMTRDALMDLATERSPWGGALVT